MRASDEWFDDAFESGLLNLSELPPKDTFRRLVDNFSYIFHEYAVPKKQGREDIKDLSKKIKILIKEAGFSCDEELAQKVRTLEKQNPSCDDIELQSDRIKKIRDNIAHPNLKRDTDYGVMRNLLPWLWKIARYYYLSMITILRTVFE